MRWIWLFAFIGLATQAQAENRHVDSPLCRDISLKIVERTAAQFVEVSDDGSTVMFRHPLTDVLSLRCDNPKLTYATVELPSPFPQPLWFTLVAEVAAAVTGDDPGMLEDQIKRCHKEALANDEHLGGFDVGRSRLNCTARTDWPFSHVTVQQVDEVAE